MSRAFDAKQAALKAYPNDKDSGVNFFLEFMDCSEVDFEYEWSTTVREYIYGEE